MLFLTRILTINVILMLILPTAFALPLFGMGKKKASKTTVADDFAVGSFHLIQAQDLVLSSDGSSCFRPQSGLQMVVELGPAGGDTYNVAPVMTEAQATGPSEATASYRTRLTKTSFFSLCGYTARKVALHSTPDPFDKMKDVQVTRLKFNIGRKAMGLM